MVVEIFLQNKGLTLQVFFRENKSQFAELFPRKIQKSRKKFLIFYKNRGKNSADLKKKSTFAA